MEELKINYKDYSFIKEVFYKSLPLIVGTIVFGLTNLLDNVMIGIFQAPNSPELAAASLGNKYVKIINIFIQASIALFSFLIFQFKGAKQEKEIKEVLKIIIQWMVVINIIGLIFAQFLANEILHFFQGSNFSDASTSSGLAQKYLKVAIFTLIPTSFYSVLLLGLNAYGKQKIILPLTLISLLINVLFNYLFYQVANLGLVGIVYATILADCISVIAMIIWIFYVKINKFLFFNPLTMWWTTNWAILRLGFSRIGMSLQSILWSTIGLGISIIYSIWYGDIANERLAIVSPITLMFYSALDGISATKGYFVGTYIGQKNPEQALINDKRINFYTFIVALIEGLILSSIAFLITKAWISVSPLVQKESAYMLICVGLTYPIAALSKTMLGSFKVAGLGKIIILSNGLFALFFEFLIPLILMLLATQADLISLSFWHIFLISRVIKLLKLPPTYYFWKKLNWLKRAF